MLDIVVASFGSKVPDEEAHRVARLLQPLVGPATAVLCAEQMLVGGRGIGVGDDDVGREPLARCEPHAGRPTPIDLDLGDGGVGIGKIDSAGTKYKGKIDSIIAQMKSGKITPPTTVKYK